MRSALSPLSLAAAVDYAKLLHLHKDAAQTSMFALPLYSFPLLWHVLQPWLYIPHMLSDSRPPRSKTLAPV